MIPSKAKPGRWPGFPITASSLLYHSIHTGLHWDYAQTARRKESQAIRIAIDGLRLPGGMDSQKTTQAKTNKGKTANDGRPL